MKAWDPAPGFAERLHHEIARLWPVLERYGIEVGGGLGPVAGKVWRFGCMGHTARIENINRLLTALSEVKSELC